MTKTVNSDAETYHDIFVPLLDVYDEGGPLAFTEFDRGLRDTKGNERNLIVVPISYVDALDDLSLKKGSWGAADSLKYINDSKSKILADSPKEGFNIYRITQGLDVCVVNADEFTKERFNMSNLEKQVMEFAKFSDAPRKENDPKQIKLITDSARHDITYTLKGHIVRKPEFLMANEDLVNEGIIAANDDLAAALYGSKDKSLPLSEASAALGGRRLYLNQFVKFAGSPTGYAMVKGNIVWNTDHSRVVGVDNAHLELLDIGSMKMHIKESRFDSLLGIKPNDTEQYLAMQHLLLNNEVALSFIAGGHGSGKTVLAWAHALDSALIYDSEERRQRGLSSEKQGFVEKVILMKAIKVLGDDVGYLPGNLYNKLKPHLRPFTGAHRLTSLNNLSFEELFRHPEYENDWGGPRASNIKSVNRNAHLPPRNELVELVYSGFVGGASEPNIAFVIDEAQDFTPYEMMVILERVGLGSRVTITGDPWQCRNPKCTLKKNGFTFALKHYLPKPYSGLVKLTKNYRHQISEDAGDMSAYPS